MTLPLIATAEDREPFTPNLLATLTPPPVFRLVFPLTAEWSAYKSELTRRGLRPVDWFVFLEQTRGCADSDLEGEARTAALQLCDQVDELREQLKDARTRGDQEAEAALLEQSSPLFASVVELWTLLTDLSAEFRYHKSIKDRFEMEAPLVAAEVFVRGWDNFPVPFEADRSGRVSKAAWRRLEVHLIKTLGRLDAVAVLQDLGNFAAKLGEISDAEGKG
jgi:hypothetical protein